MVRLIQTVLPDNNFARREIMRNFLPSMGNDSAILPLKVKLSLRVLDRFSAKGAKFPQRKALCLRLFLVTIMEKGEGVGKRLLFNHFRGRRLFIFAPLLNLPRFVQS